MPTDASQDAVPSEDMPSEDRTNGGPLTRRRFLTYAWQLQCSPLLLVVP